MKHLQRTTLVKAPFSSVIEYVAAYFEEHPRLRVKAVASTTTLVQASYALVNDRTDAARRHDALALSWQPWSRLLPAFDGMITVRPHFAGTMLGLEGSYDSPGGRLGMVFDQFFGERLARGTMDRLLAGLRRDAERRYGEFLAVCPSVEELNAQVLQKESAP